MSDLSTDILSRGFSPKVLETLLLDHTTGRNIFWATHDYEALGPGYLYNDELRPELISGERLGVVKPRVMKSRESQTGRSKDMAEVFTPSWICNAQNNLVDAAWFGREDVFNTADEATHSWQESTERIAFPEGRTWRDYVRSTRLEVTCGEAPYLVSRYDMVTGEAIPLTRRIGLLDRKLRIVGENTETSGEWLEWAQTAYQNTYGYEWQGDSLLLAREGLLLTFVEYFEAKFGKLPQEKSVAAIANIISWNLWQMDGLKGVVPGSCRDGIVEEEMTLFGPMPKSINCPGCQQDDVTKHNGRYCLVKDWSHNAEVRYIDLLD